MSVLVRRIIGAVVALLGIVVLATVIPVLSHVGSGGRATFTAQVDTAGIVSLDQHILNRVDAPVEITARASGTSDVFIGAAAPSAVGHLIGQSETLGVTGVTVPGWELLTATNGSGATAEPSRAPIWEQQATGQGSASLTIDQGNAPQRVLITTPRSGTLTSVEVTMTNSGWGTSAIWLTILGVVLLLGGLALALWGLWSRRAAGDAPGPAARRSAATPNPTQEG